MFLRYSSKAMIVEHGKLLLLTKHNTSHYLVLPGGGQEPGETLEETVKRECIEEMGATVEVGDIAFIREYREWNHEFAGEIPGFHQVDIVFHCTLVSIDPISAHEPDTYQTGTMWADLTSLSELPLYPQKIRSMFDHNGYIGPRYLGDIN